MSAEVGVTNPPDAPNTIYVKLYRIPIYGSIWISAVLGCLTRIGLNRLFSYPGNPFPSFLFSEIAGCLVMGWAMKHKILWSVGYLPLFVGVTSGYCGSLTTFGSWMLYSTLEFINLETGVYRGAFFSILAGFSVLGLTFLACMSSLHVGAYLHRKIAFNSPLRLSLEERINKSNTDNEFSAASTLTTEYMMRTTDLVLLKHKWYPRFRGKSLQWAEILNLALVVCSLAMMLCLALIAGLVDTGSNRGVVYACLFAPLGATLRYELSLMNQFFPKFPMGTFLSNFIGTIITGAMFIVSNGAGSTDPTATGPVLNYSGSRCALITGGINDGFCGCLTTISTFFIEVKYLKKRYSLFYGLLSVIVGVSSLLLTVGIVYWIRPNGWKSCII